MQTNLKGKKNVRNVNARGTLSIRNAQHYIEKYT